MLVALRVDRLAVVEHLEIDLGPGFQVVTGETGAGKSILVDALSLVLGARGGSELIRTGAQEAVVEALFDLAEAGPEVRAAVAEELGEPTDELVVRRVLKTEGRSRWTLNGQLATASQVQRATGSLVDICSQHEHHALADASAHLRFLDAYARRDPARARMASAHARWRDAAAACEALAGRWREREERAALLRFQLDEIAGVDPRPGEDEELEAERSRLAHASRLGSAARQAEGLVGTGEPSASALVSRAAHELASVRALDPALEELARATDEVLATLDDLARDLGRYARGVVEDPARLAHVEDRLGTLRRLVRKHGGSYDQLLARRAHLEGEQAGLDAPARLLEEAESARPRAADEAVALARELSEARRQASRELGAAITEELRGLGMGEARVEVDVAPLDRRAGELEADGARVTASGLDHVELLVAPNRGEPPRPLRRIASGGELSRALLAIKRVLAARGPRVLHVFDEVDTGVGGGVAEAIGRKLAEVARTSQVLCVTHLAPIAVHADRHLHVSKRVVGDRTISEIRELVGEERVEEIARMMGGMVVEDATRAAARALLAQAAALRPSAS